jgi:hypothetical protein
MRRAWRPTWLSPISPSIRLGDQQSVGVDAEILGVLGVERVLGVHEGGNSARLLRVCYRMQRQGRFS